MHNAFSGFAGDTGSSGAPGPTGRDGNVGGPGLTGPRGFDGSDGPQVFYAFSFSSHDNDGDSWLFHAPVIICEEVKVFKYGY